MNNRAPKRLPWISISLWLTLTCLPLVILGLSFLKWWFLSKDGGLFYFQYPYLEIALVYLAAALLGACAILFKYLRRGFAALLILPVGFVVVGMILFPDLEPVVGKINDSTYFKAVASACGSWAETHSAISRDQADPQERFGSSMQEIAATDDKGENVSIESQYRKAGQAIPYEVVTERNAPGPHLSHVAERPGVAYCSISSDSKEYWVTMTVLPGRSPGLASILTYRDLKLGNQPRVIHKVLQDRWWRDAN